MNITKEEFAPQLNDWFSSNIGYEGQATACFMNPKGVIEGWARVQFDEYGEQSVEMTVKQLLPEPEETIRGGYAGFLAGNDSIVEHEDGSVSVHFGSHQNTCIEFRILTQEGTFVATTPIFYSYTHQPAFGQHDEQVTLTFFLPEAQFRPHNASPETQYWVMPLSNFVSDFNFRQHHPDLDHHPLRIYQTPSVPANLSEKETLAATFWANEKNRLIIFQTSDEMGFIEPLPDFRERQQQLFAGQEKNIVTSIMVGQISIKSTEFDNYEEQLPFGFLPLLALATGNEVGVIFIELRDTAGELVRRIHKRWGHPVFVRGRVAIDEPCHCGIGRLLTKALSAQDYDKPYLTAAIKNIVRGGASNVTLESNLRALFLALDNLCQECGIRTQYQFSNENKRLLKAAIQGANKVINELANQAEQVSNKDEAYALKRVVQQLSNAQIVRTGFGKNVIALLEKFNLPDAAIIAQHYAVSPRQDKRQWSDVLPYYRGIIMHRSFFDFEAGKYTVQDVRTVINHLHDMLLRIVFMILGYDGLYQPTVIRMTAAEPVDWVKPDSSATQLGY